MIKLNGIMFFLIAGLVVYPIYHGFVTDQHQSDEVQMEAISPPKIEYEVEHIPLPEPGLPSTESKQIEEKKTNSASKADPPKSSEDIETESRVNESTASKKIDIADMSSAKPIIAEDFENGLESSWNQEMANNQYAGAMSSKYAETGTYSYRFELRDTDPAVNDGIRSEITTSKAEEPLEVHSYTFSVFLPEGGEEDYALDPIGSEIIVQWHNTPDPGEEWTYPPLALHTEGGRYMLERNWDASPMSTNNKMDTNGTRQFCDLGSYLEDKGKWVTWTFYIKWGWLSSQHPFIQVYKDGTKITELIDLPNTTNDKVGVNMKLGLYKNDWSTRSILSKRVIYFDNVIIK